MFCCCAGESGEQEFAEGIAIGHHETLREVPTKYAPESEELVGLSWQARSEDSDLPQTATSSWRSPDSGQAAAAARLHWNSSLPISWLLPGVVRGDDVISLDSGAGSRDAQHSEGVAVTGVPSLALSTGSRKSGGRDDVLPGRGAANRLMSAALAAGEAASDQEDCSDDSGAAAFSSTTRPAGEGQPDADVEEDTRPGEFHVTIHRQGDLGLRLDLRCTTLHIVEICADGHVALRHNPLSAPSERLMQWDFIAEVNGSRNRKEMVEALRGADVIKLLVIRPRQVTTRIYKEGARPLGLRLLLSSGANVCAQVSCITWGTIECYNSRVDEDRRLESGNFIVKVNQVQGDADDLMQEIKMSANLDLLFLRMPRPGLRR